MTVAASRVEADCCIVGGGPAGMMLGLLFARRGVRTIVLEKHADFLRDFRGDTIHPSTLDVMHALGLLDRLLAIPHTTIERLSIEWEDAVLPVADLTALPTRCRFVALMPQWDFLDLLASEAARHPAFGLRMRTEALGLVGERGDDGVWSRVDGVAATSPDGPIEVRARLVVACDGRHSRMREAAGLAGDTLGAPMDVVWFALPRIEGDGEPPLGRVTRGTMLVMIDRGDHWQCGYVIAKGSIDAWKAKGFDAFRASVVAAMPTIIANAATRVMALRGWDDVSVLTVAVDRLRRWAIDGLLCIGDAAHAMSPVGGVGINLAIQDSIATANRLASVVAQRRPTLAELAAVQARRDWPTRATQSAQVAVQTRVIARALDGDGAARPPLPLRAIAHSRALQRLAGRLIGVGVRPEVPRAPRVRSGE